MRTISHKIVLKHDRPIWTRPYHASDARKRVIAEQVKETLQSVIITPSTSPYASSVVLVTKKDGTLRFGVNYRKIKLRYFRIEQQP